LAPNDLEDINYLGGKVGIGTNNPQVNLHVLNKKNTASIRIEAPDANTTNLEFVKTGNINTWSLTQENDQSLRVIKNSGQANSITPMALSTNDQVGIDVNVPATKLDVKGGIRPGSSADMVLCNAAYEGTIRYVPGNGITPTKMQICKRGNGVTYGWGSLSNRPDWNQCRIVSGSNYQTVSCNFDEVMVSIDNTYTGVQGCVFTNTVNSAYIGCGEHYYAYDWHNVAAHTTIKCCMTK